MAQYPSVALQNQQPLTKLISPLDAASQALGIQEKRQGIQINALKIKEAQQEQQDEQSIRQAAQQAGNDPDAIYQALITQNPRAAEKWGKMVADRRKVETENTKAKLDNDFRRADMTERLLRSVTDDQSLQAAKVGIDLILGPGSSRELGDTYDPARIDAVRSRAISHTEYLKAQQDALENAQKAQQFELDKGKESREARQSWEKTIASFIAGTQDQNDYDRTLQSLPLMGAPKELLAPYGQNWTPQTAEKAAAVLGRQPRAKSFEEQTFDDFLKNPSLTSKYGTDRIAFDKYKQDQKIQEASARAAATGTTSDDPKTIAQAVIEGRIPPDLTGYYRMKAPIVAELAKQGFDLATADRDWKAVQKHLSTLNGAQQERLRQAVTFTYDSLDNIEDLYKQWKATGLPGGFKFFNKGALSAARQFPGEKGAIAQNLEAQINDLVSELGTVYKGGNASTDETLRLAAENLKAEWNEETFNRALGQIRKNLGIRKNSILTSQPVGVTPNSPYNPQQPTNTNQGGGLIVPGGALEKLLRK